MVWADQGECSRWHRFELGGWYTRDKHPSTEAGLHLLQACPGATRTAHTSG